MAEQFKTVADWVNALNRLIKALLRWLGITVGTPIAIAFYVVLLFALGWLVREFYEIYQTAQHDEKANELRSTIIVMTAVVGALGIPFFIYRTWLAGKQTETADRQAETARDRAYTELFTKAIEQLGAEKPAKEERKYKNGKPYQVDTFVPNIEVRIGAIYALGRIMKDSEKDAEAIVDTLAAYIRENCGEPEPFEFELPEQKEDEPVSKWIDRLNAAIGYPWGSEKGTLVRKARNLTDKPKANRADIVTALKVLADRPAKLKTKDNRPDLRGVNFQCVDLSSFDLSWLNFDNAKMQGANLSWAEMQGADLSWAEMQGADLSWAKMQGAVPSYAEMQGADLSWAKMQAAILSYAEMQGAALNYAEMQGADLRGAKMQAADLSMANMQGADLSRAEIAGTHIISARKTVASVAGVDFTKAVYHFDELKEQLLDMFGHKALTTLPEGIEPPDHWSEANVGTPESQDQYNAEWQAFKKKMGVE